METRSIKVYCFDVPLTVRSVKGAVAEILVKMSYFFVFFFIGETLSLMSC